MLKLKLQYFGPLVWRTDPLEKTLMLVKMKAGGEGDDRGWDAWMASPTQRTMVWVDAGSWWWARRPGVHLVHGVAKNQTQLRDWTELNPLSWQCINLRTLELSLPSSQFIWYCSCTLHILKPHKLVMVDTHLGLPIYLSLSLLLSCMDLWTCIYDSLFSAWRTAFRITFSIGLLVAKSLCLFFWKYLYLHSSLKNTFPGYRILYWKLFSFSPLKILPSVFWFPL